MDELTPLKPDLERLANRLEPASDAMDRLRGRRDRKAIRQRIVAGTMAGVLALGATTAVWVAFRGDGETPPVTSYAPPRAPTVWPESGLEGQQTAGVVQRRADDHDSDVVWRRSPDKVVHAFVASVLGWSEPSILPQYPHLEGSRRWYAVRESASCRDGVICDPQPPTLDIEVVQPARQGEGGIWSVATVRSSALGIVANESDPPRSGTIRGVVTTAAGLHTVAGAQWFDGCAGANDVLDDIRRPGRFVITLPDPAPAAAPGCGSVAAGYVYAYSVPRVTQPVGDPLLESASISDLTIVPIRVQTAGEAPVPTGLAEQLKPVAPKLPPVPWAAYEDPLGWSIAYPPGWGHEPLRGPDATGIRISNDPDARVRGGIPQHDVFILEVRHSVPGKQQAIPTDDSELPILLQDFVLHANASGSRAPAYGFSAVRLGGIRLDLSVVFGRAIDPSTMHQLDRVLGTIRFVTLNPGYRFGEHERLLPLPFVEPPPGRAVIEPLDGGSVLMVVHADGGLYALKLDTADHPDVSRWEWDADARQVVYGDLRWSWDGVPLDLVSVDPLPTFPVARGWDGHLLARTASIALNPGYWP